MSNGFHAGMTVLVVAVPEGLPLAVTLSFALSVKVCLSSLFLFLTRVEIMLCRLLECCDNLACINLIINLYSINQKY